MIPLSLMIRATPYFVAVAVLWFAYFWAHGRGEAEVQARWDASIAAQVKANADEQLKQTERIAQIDKKHTEEMRSKNAELSRLRAGIADGSIGLRINAECPAVSSQGDTSRVDSGGAAKLGRAAAENYLSLRAGITKTTEQLKACQALLKQ